ncbi:MAG: aldehyde dehydrogenase family protein [Saprospiraceae bacterium]|nr:aldehyde dehydrogenase family protein [Saprospiraceae bacterium]
MNKDFLNVLNLHERNCGTWAGLQSFPTNQYITSTSPVDGATIGEVTTTSEKEYQHIIDHATKAFKEWRKWPAPKRGEVVRQFGLELRKNKEALGLLVSYEMGKSLQEGLGEVQEMIDICDFAVGLSRQLYGLTMHSERPNHRMYEQWHPLGVVGVISAFNFPVAVWSWNAMIALVCGDSCIWKSSEKTPLCAIACQHILGKVLEKNRAPGAISCIISGGREVGEFLTHDKRVPLISATGSCRMGRSVGSAVASRLGKSLLELGGNNAIIITPSADLDLVIRGAVFGAVGTAGQRCTSTRRLIIHSSIFEEVSQRLVLAYKQLKIGTPLDSDNHMGPLIDKQAADMYVHAIEEVKNEGGSFLVEGKILEGTEYKSGCYVSPSIAIVTNKMKIVQEETFAPLLYLIKYDQLQDAIDLQNGVDQGLSSAMMTNDLRESEVFLSAAGSDCGIANVNIGTSGAEIGGAFGGEKDTGGGRESGSDAWKAYMRRQTNTINYGDAVPLAQGISFEF